MQRKSKSELLKELKAKEEILKARIANLESRQRKEEDRLLTRKKILIGAHILEKTKNDESARAVLTKELDQFLIRPHDRKLFGLALKIDHQVTTLPMHDLPKCRN